MGDNSATFICLDNSEWVRNGDYLPTRLEAQTDAINLICLARSQQHPENTFGVLSMGGRVEVLVSLTTDQGKVMTGIHDVKIGGKADILSAIQVAQLGLKNRQNKKQKQKIILFVGSPIFADSNALVRLGKVLKKNNISVDVVNFGEEAENTAKLENFVNAVNSHDNSHLVTVPPGPHILSDVLLTSAIIYSDTASSGDSGPTTRPLGGVDPNLDPELALALQLSLQESKAREEAESKKAQEDSLQTTTTATPQTPSVPSTSTNVPVVTDADMMDVEDEEALLAHAIKLSMQQEGGAGAANAGVLNSPAPSGPASTPGAPPPPKKRAFDELSEEEQMEMALQLSLQSQAEEEEAEQKKKQGK